MLTKDTTMSFSQFGYPYNATSQFFVSANPSPTTCCDSLSRSVSDGSAGPQTPAASASSASSFCCGGGGSSCGERRLAGGGGGRAELSAALGMYSSPYAAAAAAAAASQSYANYFPYGAEPSSALYSTLNPQYDIKDGTGALHSGITQTAAYYPYDHSLGQYQYDRYGTVDFNSTARRKNATRETTSTLKTWLYEHRKNPYPTKGEKIMLAIITKMTLTQVSTWFANARRRLKKENKMTWSPKNKGGEDRKDDLEKSDLDCVTKDSSDCKEKDLHLSDLDDMEDEDCDKGLDSDCEKGPSEEEQQQQHQGLHRAMAVSGAPLAKRDCGSELHLSVHNGFHPFPCGIKSLTSLPGLPSDFLDSVALKPLSTSSITTTSSSSLSSPPSSCGPPAGALSLSHYEALDKPRIWSLARTAASGLALSPHPGSEVRTAGDCQLPGSRIPPPPPAPPPPVVAPTVACRVAAAGLHTSSHAENPFQEGPPSHPKIYGAGAGGGGGYGHKGLQMHCSSFPALQDACQFASIEGFAGVKAETESPGLSRACGGGLQEDKVTAFRPVMKR